MCTRLPPAAALLVVSARTHGPLSAHVPPSQPPSLPSPTAVPPMPHQLGLWSALCRRRSQGQGSTGPFWVSDGQRPLSLTGARLVCGRLDVLGRVRGLPGAPRAPLICFRLRSQPHGQRHQPPLQRPRQDPARRRCGAAPGVPGGVRARAAGAAGATGAAGGVQGRAAQPATPLPQGLRGRADGQAQPAPAHPRHAVEHPGTRWALGAAREGPRWATEGQLGSAQARGGVCTLSLLCPKAVRGLLTETLGP